MKVGVFIFPTDYSMPIIDLAVELEQRGFDYLFAPEHTHIPSGRKTPWPGGGELPKEYSHTLDPFVGLAAAAAATKKIRLGTGICLVSQRDPIVMAKEVASLDMISNGRFDFGIGAGWNEDELANHGTEYSTRFRMMVDRTKAMQAIWTEDEASYSGEFTSFEKIWSWPKPIQKPHPPIWLGGETKHTLKRVVDFCDGWFPRGNVFDDPAPKMQELKDYAEQAGRDYKTIKTIVFRAEPEQGYLDRCQSAGCDGVLFGLPSADKSTLMAKLDSYSPFLN